MLKRRGMAVFQQMRTVVMFATVTQKWDTSEVKFSVLSKNPINTERGVVAIRKGARTATTGFVAASQDALCDIAAMSAPKAKDRLIKGVPYVVRRQGAAALAEYVNNPQDTGDRYSLPCNTGPKGSGKTVLQRQNMLQVARDFGFLAVEIEFNDIQPLDEFEKKANFARRVANRILCYLPKYCALEWSECLEAIARDFEWEDESTMSDVEEAVEVLKDALNHDGPVLLAVDELVRVPSGTNFELTDLCGIMDSSLGWGNTKDMILPVVSMYDFVDLGKLLTGSSRLLVHQKLPPILPVLLDSSVEKCLPTGSDWLPASSKVLFNTKLRASLGEEAFGSVAKLLTESGGHPRRVEALIAEGNVTSEEVRENKKNRSADEVSELQTVMSGENTCLEAMDKMLDLRAMGRGLSGFVLKGDDKDTIILVLLKYLFRTVDMDNQDAKILRSATTKHYQLVPHDAGHVGYLALPALQSFCVEVSSSCSKYAAYRVYSLSKEYESFLVHAKGVADANLSTTIDAKQRSKMSMFHALCGAVLAEGCLTEDMFRHSPENLPETCCTEIEWAKDVELFPSAVENGATLRVCDDKTLHRICEVGAFNEEGRKQLKGLAFVPTDKWNTCCDFVLVLPTADWERAGRVVFAVQCKHWTKDVAGKKGLHDLAHFRYGRHCFEADEVFLQKNKEGAAKRYAHSWRLSSDHMHLSQCREFVSG